MIHVGDMLQKEEGKKKKLSFIYPVVLQVVCF